MRNDHCTWVTDAVQKEKMTKVASRIVPNGQYYLRMRIKFEMKFDHITPTLIDLHWLLAVTFRIQFKLLVLAIV